MSQINEGYPEAIAVRRLIVHVGLSQDGKMMGLPHTASEQKKLFVVPGRLAIIVTITPGRTTITELPINQFGVEYEPISE